MNLGDRGGGDRLAEFGKQRLQLHAMGCFDDGAGLGHREGRHPVLQGREVLRDLHADDIGPRRQELAEFHIGRAEPGHRGREPCRGGTRAAPLDQPADADQPARQRRQHGGIDERQRPFARQHETDARAAQHVEEGGDHAA